MTFREVRSAQQAEITRLGPTSIGSPRHSGRSASCWTTPTHAAPRLPFLQRRITNPTSDQTPVPGSALHPNADPHQPPTYRVLLPLPGLPSDQTPVEGWALHRHWPPTYHVRLPLSGLPPGQTRARGLPLLLLEQSAAVHSPPPVVGARVRLPVQLLARRHAPVSVAPSPAL